MPNPINIVKTKPWNFFNEVKAELVKVAWPTKEEATRLTGIVIFVSIAVGLFVGALDFIFTSTASILLKR